MWKGKPNGKSNLLVITQVDKRFERVHFKDFNVAFMWSTRQGLEALSQKEDWDYIFLSSQMWEEGKDPLSTPTKSVDLAKKIVSLKTKPLLVVIVGQSLFRNRILWNILQRGGVKVAVLEKIGDKKPVKFHWHLKDNELDFFMNEVEPPGKIYNPADIPFASDKEVEV